MRNSERIEIAGSTLKGAALTGGLSVAAGWAVTTKTILWGTVVVATPISWPAVACYAAAGAAVGGLGKYAGVKLKHRAMRRSFAAAQQVTMGENRQRA